MIYIPNRKGFQNTGSVKSAEVQRARAIEKYYENPNICRCCGKVIEISENEKVTTVRKKKFCNRKCSTKHINKMNKARQKNLIELIGEEELLKIVLNSNDFTEVFKEIGYKNRVDNKRRETLIRKLTLLNIDFSHLETINMSSTTKKELFNSNKNWQSARSQIARHARKVYENSVKSKCCHICEYNKHYEVCHIHSVSEFSDNALIVEINHIDNLVALCPNHHWEYDNSLITL